MFDHSTLHIDLFSTYVEASVSVTWVLNYLSFSQTLCHLKP